MRQLLETVSSGPAPLVTYLVNKPDKDKGNYLPHIRKSEYRFIFIYLALDTLRKNIYLFTIFLTLHPLNKLLCRPWLGLPLDLSHQYLHDVALVLLSKIY